jgi:two-component system, NarL family, nitrate/nitrite response regulator NarL
VASREEATPPVVGVVIVAAVRLYRDSLAAALAPFDHIEVLGTAGDWGEACSHVKGRRPDILLVEASLATAGRGARLLAQSAPNLRVVALAVAEDERAVLSCLEAGVSAYVSSDATLPELVEAIERTAGGELLCSPRIAGALGRRVSDLAAEREPSRHFERLTAREIEIAHLIEQRLSNQEIATRLCIEVPTVKNHVHNILAKLGIQSRADVADWVHGATFGAPR